MFIPTLLPFTRAGQDMPGADGVSYTLDGQVLNDSLHLSWMLQVEEVSITT